MGIHPIARSFAAFKWKYIQKSPAVRSITASNVSGKMTCANTNWPGRCSRPANGIFEKDTQLVGLSRGGRHPTTRSTLRRRSHRSRNRAHNRGSHGNRDTHGSHRNGSPRPSAGSRPCHQFPCRTDGRSRGSRQQFPLRRATRIATAKSSVSAECPQWAASMRKHRLRAKRSTRQRPTLVLPLLRHASA